MYVVIGLIILIGAIVAVIWYNGKHKAEDAIDAEASKAEAKAAQEARTRMEEQRSRDNESARLRDVSEATEAVAGGRVGDFLRDSLQDDPSTN